MMSEPQELVEAALTASGADGCVALVADHTEANLRWAGNSLTTNGRMASRHVTVISTFERPGGTSVGVVTRSVASVEEVDDLVRASESAGREAAIADDAAPLIEPDESDDDWGAPPRQTGIEVFEAFAPELGAAFGRWRAADRLLFGFAEHQMTSCFVGSSTGLRRRFDQPTGRLEINGKAGERSASAWDGLHTRDFTDIDVDAVTAGLEQRLDWSRARVELPAGRYETILPPTAVADFMVQAYWSAGARDADEGRSVYAAGSGGVRVGEQLAGLPLSLRSDPAYPGLQCCPFEAVSSPEGGLASVFDNGRPTPATSWIDRGRLATLVGNRAWAARSSTPTAPMIDNLVLDGAPDPVTLEQMIASTERGLLLTCLWYLREVDPQTLLLTGLTRDGVFLVEDGRVTGAVNNFRFNESPIDLLARATQAGATVPTLSREWSDYFTRTAMPALRIPDFNMSTVSPAS